MGEKNQAKWIGIRPTDPAEDIPITQTDASKLKATIQEPLNVTPKRKEGSQVTRINSAQNSTAVIYTVPTGQTLYLCLVVPSCIAVATGYGRVFIRDENDNVLFSICWLQKPANDGHAVGIPFNPPLEIPGDYDICVQSLQADFHMYGFIFGYLI